MINACGFSTHTQHVKVHPKKFNFISNIPHFDKSFKCVLNLCTYITLIFSTDAMRNDAVRCDDIAQSHFDIHEFAMSLMDTVLPRYERFY